MKYPSAFVSALLMLTLTACPPANQTISTPSPSPEPSASPSSSTSSSNPSTPQSTSALRLNLRGDTALTQFSTQQSKGVCLDTLKEITTTFTLPESLTPEAQETLENQGLEISGRVITWTAPVANLAAFVSGFNLNLTGISQGQIQIHTQFQDSAQNILGSLKYTLDLSQNEQSVNVLFKALEGESTDPACPVLAPDITGASLTEAGGGLIIDIDPQPSAEPSIAPSASPSSEPSPSAPALPETLKAPLSLGLSSKSSSTLTVFWSAEEKSEHSYTLFLDGQEFKNGITGRSFTFSNLNADRAYTLGLKAVNASAQSEMITLEARTNSGSSGGGGGGGGGSSSGGGSTPAPTPTPVPAPVLNALNPSSGFVGSSVTLTGANFSTTLNDNAVSFGGTAATVTAATANSLTVTVPTMAEGATQVSVTVNTQASGTQNFTVTPLPKGVVYNGESSLDLSGYALSGAGDFNGDGVDDLLIGAQQADPNSNNNSGKTYVIYGGAPTTTSFNLADITSGDGSKGFVIHGEAANDTSGYAVSDAGDVNGDGKGDIIIGAYQADPNAANDSGAAYVIYGGSVTGNTLNLADIRSGDGSKGFVLNGEAANNRTGISVSGAGDVNKDGKADVIVGADQATTANGAKSGRSYVVYGGAVTTGSFNLSDLTTGDGSKGFVINGEGVNEFSGYSVHGAGDVNKDGNADVVIGAYAADPGGLLESGRSYVVYGGANNGAATLNLSEITTGDGSKGFSINGEAAGDCSGYSVSGAGDVNNDGNDDVIIGSWLSDPNANNNSGKAFVIYGGKVTGPTLNLADLTTGDGTVGFVLNGETAGNQTGISVSGAGDVNNDGKADVIVGANKAAPNGTKSGRSYVVYGGANNGAANLNLSDVTSGDGSKGFTLNGEVGDDESGFAVSGAGDINNDGKDDVLVGAFGADAGDLNKGRTYLLFGGGITTTGLFELNNL